jgi:hypothetical protein
MRYVEKYETVINFMKLKIRRILRNKDVQKQFEVEIYNIYFKPILL